MSSSSRSAAILLSALLIVSCGGGGGGGGGGDNVVVDNPAPADTMPSAFSFESRIDVNTEETIESNPVTVSGINTAVIVSIIGGEYSIDNGTYTSQAGSINNGQSVKLRVTSAQEGGKETFATLTIGDLTTTFSVATFADITPALFSFDDQIEVALNTFVQSNQIVVAELNTTANISIANGEYSINGQSFTNAPGSVTNGDAVIVRQFTASEELTTTTAVLTIGNVEGTFSVRTHFAAPVGEIRFPPAVSQTDGAVVLIRGTALSTAATPSPKISSVQIISPLGPVAAELSASPSSNLFTWSAAVPLAPGENSLQVEVTDEFGQRDANADNVKVTRIEPPLSGAAAITIGNDLDRAYFLDRELKVLFSLDLASGKRTPVSKNGFPTRDTFLYSPHDLVIDVQNDRALIIDDPFDYFGSTYNSSSRVIAVDLKTGERAVFASKSFPDANTPLQTPMSIAIDPNNNRALVVDQLLDAVVAIDLTTAQRTILSDNSTPGSEGMLDTPWSIVIPTDSQVAYIYDLATDIIFGVDLEDGTRRIVSEPSDYNQAEIGSGAQLGLDTDGSRLIAGNGRNQLIEIDIASGQRRLISENASGQRPLLVNNLVYFAADRQILKLDTTTNIRSAFTSDGALTDNNVFTPVSISKPRLGTAYVYGFDSTLYQLDLDTGERTAVSQEPNPFNPLILFATDIAHDFVNNQVLVTDYNSRIYSIDLSTGARALLAEQNHPPDEILLSQPFAIEMDSKRNQAIVANFGSVEASLMSLSPLSGEKGVVSSLGHPEPAQLSGLEGLAVDTENDEIFAVRQGSSYDPSVGPALIKVDLPTGSRTLISWNYLPESEANFVIPTDLVLSGFRALVVDRGNQQLVATDLSSGERTFRFDTTVTNEPNTLGKPTHMEKDKDFLYISDQGLRAIVVVDLVTNTRVMISRDP